MPYDLDARLGHPKEPEIVTQQLSGLRDYSVVSNGELPLF
jgi:hypothetical protein